MRLPNWALPVVVIAFVAIRILVARQFRRSEGRETGNAGAKSVPIWIKAFWVALAVAVVALLFWNPRR